MPTAARRLRARSTQAAPNRPIRLISCRTVRASSSEKWCSARLQKAKSACPSRRGELPGVGLDEEDLLVRRRGVAGDLQRLELEIHGHDRDLLSPRASPSDEIAAMVGIARGEVGQDHPAPFRGQFPEQARDGAARPEGPVQSREMLQILPQSLAVGMGQVHQFGIGGGKLATHPARMPILGHASPFFEGGWAEGGRRRLTKLGRTLRFTKVCHPELVEGSALTNFHIYPQR